METESLLRLPEVERRTGLRRAHLYKLARAGTFPKPLKIGARASAWRASQVAAWIASRVAADARDAAA
jgi:prophage regulatory protein